MSDERTASAPAGTFETALHEVARARTRRRRWLAIIGLPVVAAAGVGAWVWKPWQSVNLPESACWSVVTKADLKPLADDDGTATVDSSGDLSGRMPYPDCRIYWNGAKHKPLLSVTVLHPSDTVYNHVLGLGKPGTPLDPRPIELGAGVTGWITRDANVDLVYRCDAADAADSPFREILVSGGPVSGDSHSASVREAHVGLAWRTAAAAIRAEGCRSAALVASQPAAPAQ
ncbi:hypothetical protein [Kitasatospora sp. NPDC087314]|uniref:hypothetical protein n=1 Tax=Kitasatospora sp. NPDC087314 TaxID=3364068 RepID=UPI003830AF78